MRLTSRNKDGYCYLCSKEIIDPKHTSTYEKDKLIHTHCALSKFKRRTRNGLRKKPIHNKRNIQKWL